MTNDYMYKFNQIISKNGYRLTKSREETFKALLDTEPQPISNIISRTSGKVDRVSVYRNIELFEKLGIVNRINTGWKYKLELSDNFIIHHHHVVCERCGETKEIKNNQIEEIMDKICRDNGLVPTKHHFELFGICSSCDESRKPL